MINTYRYLDILLFNSKIPHVVGDLTVRVGWNQIIRKDSEYFIRDIHEREFYGSFPVSIGHTLVSKIFGHLND